MRSVRDNDSYTVLQSECRPLRPRVSVLTPIYNVERYLPQCLESLCAQTLAGIEFICVNDGSTDGCLDLLKRYAEADDRFVVIDKPNSGYGASMNVALSEARGTYVGIVESDDWADSEMFENLYLQAFLDDLDICKSNYYQYEDEGGSTYTQNFLERDCGVVFRPNDPDWQFVMHHTTCIWSALYRHDLLRENDIWFNETPGASFQDTGFVLKAWVSAQRAMLVNDAYLHYRVDRTESSVKSSAKVLCVCDEYEEIERWLAERPALKDEIVRRVQAVKVGTYDWNANRLESDARQEFLQRAKREFEVAIERGELDVSLLTDRRQAFVRDVLAGE